MKKYLLLSLITFSSICSGQGGYSPYSQLKPLEGSISSDMQQVQANTFRIREEKRERERIKNERNQSAQEAEYKIANSKAIYQACINSNTVSKLYLFGGKESDVLLGCLNCDKYDSESIWNEFGKYGSKYNSQSIWNKYGTYGGSGGRFSPFNRFSTPPKIIDAKGYFIGYFTTDKYFADRKNNEILNAICDDSEFISENINLITK